MRCLHIKDFAFHVRLGVRVAQICDTILPKQPSTIQACYALNGNSVSRFHPPLSGSDHLVDGRSFLNGQEFVYIRIAHTPVFKVRQPSFYPSVLYGCVHYLVHIYV